jgi:hypothetical protein
VGRESREEKLWIRAQNEPVVKSHETAKKVGEQVGKSQATVRRIAKKVEAIEKAGKLDEYQAASCPRKRKRRSWRQQSR